MDRFGGELFVDHLPHAFAAAFDGNRERPTAAFGQDPSQVRGDRGGSHGTHADARAVEAVLIQPMEQIGELGVLGDRSTQQSKPLGGGQTLFHRRDQTIVQRWCAEGEGEVAGQTEAAQLRTTPHHFHHVHVRPGGLRCHHRGVAEGVAAPGLFFNRLRQPRLNRFHPLQLAVAVVLRGIERGHVYPWHLSEVSQPCLTVSPSALLESIDEGGQQQLPIPEQHRIKEGSQRFRVGGQYRTATKDDRVLIATLHSPDGNALVLQQLRQHWTIQLPAQGQPEQIAVARQRITLVCEQSPHVDIAATRQGRPDDLIPEAGDPHRIGAGKRQHGLEGIGFRCGRIEQQGFLIQLVSPEGPEGGVGGVNGRR